MRVTKIVFGIAGGLLGWVAAAAPAQAAWLEATTRHFTVYAEGREADVRGMAERLERYDGVLRLLQNIPDATAQGSNRVTVYVVPSIGAIQRLIGRGDNVAGFYIPRASGSVAFTPRGTGDGGAFTPQVVLFHEYAHHLLIGRTGAIYPRWFMEGFAEFLSTTRFDKDGIQLGVAAQHRAGSLFRGSSLSARSLFAADNAKLNQDQTATLYARGWLLTHYLMLDADRRRQCDEYLRLVNDGIPSVEAATRVWGDLRQLDRAIDTYLNRSTIPGWKLRNEAVPTPTVAIRALSPGEAAMMGYRMRSDRGVNRITGAALYAEAAPVAARYPGDAAVQTWQAEIAYDAGQDAEASAAADRALAVDPKAAQALLYKGLVALRAAGTARSTDPAVWQAARQWIVRANRVDPDEAEPLMRFYQSFRMQRIAPTKSAIAGLRRAHELMPQDRGIRMLVVRQALAEGDVAAARVALRPLAYDPHAAADNPAARLLTIIDAGGGAEAAKTAAAAEGDDEP